MLYSRSLLVIYFKYKSVYMSIPDSLGEVLSTIYLASSCTRYLGYLNLRNIPCKHSIPFVQKNPNEHFGQPNIIPHSL